MANDDNRRGEMILAGTLVGFFVFVIFIVALCESRSGEIAAALASLIGSTIGIGGAALAVFLTFQQQRLDESKKVSQSIDCEVAEFSRFIAGIHHGLHRKSGSPGSVRELQRGP
jgi:hypothetical protein